jgi:hypothetical protein
MNIVVAVLLDEFITTVGREKSEAKVLYLSTCKCVCACLYLHTNTNTYVACTCDKSLHQRIQVKAAYKYLLTSGRTCMRWRIYAIVLDHGLGL